MIRYEPFRAAHLQFLKPQAAQRGEYDTLMRSGGASVLETPMALSGWRVGRCVGCAGLVPVRPHRAVAWMLLGEGAGEHILSISRKIKRVIAASPYKRVELTVRADFEGGQRFARLIGAKQETPEPMRFYGADEADEILYAVVKEA